ncbi:MAG: hypothetical protein KKD05_01480 [Candidatus Omnitrophica bacterium]|nr:hypothetical protein [Candidatus Omnitrophota bacterium]
MSNKVFARALNYIDDLRNRGKLSFLRNKNLIGTDIDIQFRGDYLNLYYKGASLLKFKWLSKNTYEITISKKYLEPSKIAWLQDKNRLNDNSLKPIRKNFKQIVAQLKRNIRYLGKGKENAFEQIFIENNCNVRNRPSFIVIDRQVVIPGSKDRLDLVAISKIDGVNEYRLNLIELKYGEDKRIPKVHDEQLEKYHLRFKNDYPNIAKQYQAIIRQKMSIGLLPYLTQDISISKDSSTMKKIAVFGNIRDDHRFVEQARSQFDENTFYVIQNNILEESKMKKCN